MVRDGGAWGIWLKSDGYYEGSYVALTLLLVSEVFLGTKYMAEVELRRLRVTVHNVWPPTVARPRSRECTIDGTGFNLGGEEKSERNPVSVDAKPIFVIKSRLPGTLERRALRALACSRTGAPLHDILLSSVHYIGSGGLCTILVLWECALGPLDRHFVRRIIPGSSGTTPILPDRARVRSKFVGFAMGGTSCAPQTIGEVTSHRPIYPFGFVLFAGVITRSGSGFSGLILAPTSSDAPLNIDGSYLRRLSLVGWWITNDHCAHSIPGVSSLQDPYHSRIMHNLRRVFSSNLESFPPHGNAAPELASKSAP
ncbi:hypothetical protein FA13DRAFT_1713691 [Coprinellus micaceus]|uniref:Uncharacterized protein n=1 Tax=Coprinellus micaceus TaxID=71717 RepID=A0A4Y7SVD5_COPMI|nr:hypothetical protein FA13DRAFT_1713691 [Coprinellus micaceus]